MRRRIAILQPEIPHYRTEFFTLLKSEVELLDLYTYHFDKNVKKSGFCVEMKSMHIPNMEKKGLLLYAPWKLLSNKYDTLVLMLHQGHITTWILLLTKWLHRKRIVVWGQGISVKRYLQEQKKPSRWLKWQIALADGAWIYEEPEARQWKTIFPSKPIVALNNTLTGVEEILRYVNDNGNVNGNDNENGNGNDNGNVNGKDGLKRKWGITEKVVLIFCARFENNYRRVDLLVETMERLDSEKYGFIIIGDGKNKPDFSRFPNVHDFGAVYDNTKKRELFAVADIYFQPGWVGLSIVEAMAYGKPIFTFRRSKETLQCVEYCYIKEKENGLIFDDMEDLVRQMNIITQEQIKQMGEQARLLVKEKLTPRQMAESALSIL